MEREREIRAFIAETFWVLTADVQKGAEKFMVTCTEEPRDHAEVARILAAGKTGTWKVRDVKETETKRAPRPPFITSTLQQASSTRLGYSPARTMQLAQKLYEAGLITYMRTDSVNLSPEFCAQARQWLETNDPVNLPQKAARHRQVKGSQEAHEAIRPTDLYRPSQELRVQLSADDFALYLLIWKRAVATQCQSARLRQTRIVTQSGAITWQSKGQVIEFPGYSKYWNNISADTDLPLLQQKQPLTLERAAHEPKQTQPPPRYSEPKLVQAMERQGIGRPSTYAPTLQTLKQRLYVELVKGSLQPTGLGLEVDAFLQDALPDLLEAEFTAQMEQALDQIAAGEQNWETYLTQWNRSYFAPALVKARQVIPQHLTTNPPPRREQKGDQQLDRSRTRCPQCNAYLAKVPSKKLKKKYFLKCVEACPDLVLFWSEQSRQWEVPRAKNADLPQPELTDHACPVCQKRLEAYAYEKEGQVKRLLRCSNAQARTEKKHQEAVYFQTAQGWWSPKFGALN
jgi:DNA topoisomerase-1